MKHLPIIDPTLTKESLLYSNSVKTKFLYILIVISIIVCIALLPVIKVAISVQGRGIIRPISEKTEVMCIRSEIVDKVHITEGQFVEEGDTLISLRSDILDSKNMYLLSEKEKYIQYIRDLEFLSERNFEVAIQSVLYEQQLRLFLKKEAEYNSRIVKATKDVERNQYLFEKEIISEKEFEDINFNLNQYIKEKSTLESNQLASWKSDLANYRSELKSLDNQITSSNKEKVLYTIMSPVTGTIEEFSGIYTGTLLQAGQTVAVISPSSEIQAEVFVSAKDIGYLRNNQAVKLQVDAFNYNEWGTLEGKVISISDDFILANDIPVFNVKCKLDRNHLELKSGVKGNLKKGMTVNARFMAAKRSLFQMLYQKSDDLINPTRSALD